jgi:predicted nucleic acid-binding protein
MTLADLRDGDRVFIDANAQGLGTARTAVRKLGETPEMVKQLTQYQEDVRKIPLMHLTILPLTLDIVQASAEVRKSEGLLTNDSFVVALMREQGLTRLATANGDFDRVGGMTIYKPTDLEEDTPEKLSV